LLVAAFVLFVIYLLSRQQAIIIPSPSDRVILSIRAADKSVLASFLRQLMRHDLIGTGPE